MKVTYTTIKEKEATMECTKWEIRDGFFIMHTEGKVYGMATSQILFFNADKALEINTPEKS